MQQFRLRPIAWFLLAALPIAAYAASAGQEYAEVLRSKPDPAHGAVRYAICAACHGAEGAGVADGSVPAIAAQRFRVIVRELVDFRHDRRWHTQMEHFADEHNLGDAQSLADVARYISALKPVAGAGTGNGAAVNTGAMLYARACASCHDRSPYPKLAGQHYEYLLRQMDDAATGRRSNFAPEHVRLLQRIGRDESAAVADYLSRSAPR
jgi:cytochrome c553